MSVITAKRPQTGVVRRPKVGLAALLFVSLLILSILAGIRVGVVPIRTDQVLAVFATQLGLSPTIEVPQITAAVIWDLRVPRVLLALGVGAALAACGAAMQGLFGNPLADPGIVGVSSGASLGAIAVIVLDISVFGPWTLPAGAFIMGILTTTIIYFLARPGQGGGTVTLLLVGMAVNAIISAANGYLTYLADTQELESITFWGMGSLGTADWTVVPIVLPLALVGILILFKLAPGLDLLSLGERQARHLGVDVNRLRGWLVVITALLVAAAVSFVGTIGFVGLVVPHLVRLLVGPKHRSLIPLSAAGGALLVILADIGARTLDPPAEVPIGILTATLGGPFFLWLIFNNSKELGIRQ